MGPDWERCACSALLASSCCIAAHTRPRALPPRTQHFDKLADALPPGAIAAAEAAAAAARGGDSAAEAGGAEGPSGAGAPAEEAGAGGSKEGEGAFGRQAWRVVCCVVLRWPCGAPAVAQARGGGACRRLCGHGMDHDARL